MKSKYIKIVFTLIMACLTYSCSEDFLEVAPKGVITPETTKDYDLMLNSNKLWNYGSPEIYSSLEACALEPFWSTSRQLEVIKNEFRWLPETTDSDRIRGVIAGFVDQLYVLNKVINEVLSSSEGTETQKNIIMAQARAARAFIYFKLINFYGMPYNAATAATDLGVPLITEASVTQQGFTRATVQETYDFIMEELNIAIPLLPNDIGENSRMYKAPAKALLAKVYVYMNRFSEALALFDEALSETPARVQLFDYNVTTLPGGVHQAGIFGPRFVTPIENISALYRYALWHPDGFTAATVLLSPEVSALFGASDFRLHHFFSRFPFRSSIEFSVPGVYRRIGTLVVEAGIALPDIYLLRAECNARNNNLSAAVADLELLRSHRMDPADAAVPAGMSQDDLIKYVIEERTREFASKGELWFDMRRLWNDPLFQDKKPYVHNIYNADGSISETFTLVEDRLVFRFADLIMEQNPDMINNP